MDDQPTPRDTSRDPDRARFVTPPRTDRPDDPTPAERRGLGDIGEIGDESASGELDEAAGQASTEGLDRLSSGELGAGTPIGPEQEGGRATAGTGGIDAGDPDRNAAGRARDARAASPTRRG